MKFDFTPHGWAAFHKAYLKDKGRISIPGFRKGKAPRKLIENMYGKSIFYETAFDLLFPDVYRDAVEKEEAETVDRPEIDITQIGEGEDLKFTVTVYVRPDVTLGNYKGLEVTALYLPLPMSSWTPASGRMYAARPPCRMYPIDLLRRWHHCYWLSWQAERCFLWWRLSQWTAPKIGSNTFIPGFEEQVVGMNIGEEKVITVTFPENTKPNT